ncbi:MAG: nitroreductase family protein [Candidatus Hadarchaeota archaeon]
MHVSKAIRKRRSIRKFKDKRVDYDDLEALVEAARLAPSAANLQPLEYLIVDDPEIEKDIFEYTEWAGYVDWEPSFEKRPRAYILILVDEENMNKWYKYDAGLAAENICLSAVDRGLATCILGAIDRDSISEMLNAPEEKRIDLAVAVGFPDQKSDIDESADDPVRYGIDDEMNFRVPKRSLEDVLHRNRFEGS